MKIYLTELLQKAGRETDLEAKIEPKELNLNEAGLLLTQPAKAKLHLVNTGVMVLLTGSVATTVELVCSRCLQAYSLPLTVKLKEEFSALVPEPKGSGEVELKAADFVYPIEPDKTIDLSEIIRQNLLLAIPIKTLCQKACQGIKKEGE